MLPKQILINTLVSEPEVGFHWVYFLWAWIVQAAMGSCLEIISVVQKRNTMTESPYISIYKLHSYEQ